MARKTTAVPSTPETPTAAKPARAARKTVPVRKYKESPAGHFADALKAVGARLSAMDKKTTKWEPSISAKIVALAGPLSALQAVYAGLDASNFRPAAGNRFKIPTFVSGQSVAVTAECLELLKKDFPELTDEHEIQVAKSVKDGDKVIPLVSGSVFLGRVSYKWLNQAADLAA